MGAIRVSDVGKAYKLYPTRWSRVAEWLGRGNHHQLIWVLRGINFLLEPGESLGIVGVNGAGKSTLLKLIVGTIKPTTGQVSVQGRVSALLELGMGFHPEFTGRQNVAMAAQLSGLTLEEIQALMPNIEEFAEIGDYIDRPLRVFSSGMQMRLAFSVATARRPDILIVDEALSVGDDYFQHKSFERIREFRRQGTTLLIVSHAKSAIQSICDRAVLLHEGTLIQQGKPETVFDYYNALLAEWEAERIHQQPAEGGSSQTASGSGEAKITSVGLLSDHDEPVTVIDVDAEVQLAIQIHIHAPIPRLVMGFLIKDHLGQPIFGTNTHYLDCPLENALPGEVIDYRCAFPARLGPGSYSVSVALHESSNHVSKNYHWRDHALIFRVVNLSYHTFAGCTWLAPEVRMIRRDLPNK